MLRWPFSRRKKWPELGFDEIKKRSRLLVIDDMVFPYQSLLKRDGYSIDKWSDVEDLARLERGEFDLILLDIQGVGRDFSDRQGLGIIKFLKGRNPAQMIIAYSDSDWSLAHQEFFDLADAKLAKSQDYYDFRRVIDSCLKQKFSVGFYLAKIRDLLELQNENTDDITALVERAIQKRDIAYLEGKLPVKIDDPNVINMILQVANTAITVITACMRTS